ncbi:MAG: HD-GYP domain-containing protein [Desulfovibrio sp.]|jgi:HD-GYP domain-containing protein (c-di-GMP phosphodiesterase class II)|nr:HD-GYP domain-containing protein [Desulfovibrio sp.]
MAYHNVKTAEATGALKHLHILELKAGMYVANPGIDWRGRPYLYMREGLLASDDEVRNIAAEGYLEVYIDPDRSPAYADAASLEAEPDGAEVRGKAPAGPKVPFVVEIKAAAEAHDAAVDYARAFMSDIRFGKLDMSPASNIVERIMRSLDNNTDALQSLCRLRRTDSYTYMHCVNVSVLSSMFARYMDKGAQTTRAIGLAGLFHDLGKALVPPQILNAPRRLSDAERLVMNTHPTLGYEQIKDVPNIIPEVLQGVLHHHECYNGSGYPAGLSGYDVSEVGYIVALADIYDALTSRRVYKDGMPPQRALGIMYEMRGRALRPEMVAAFIRMLGVYPVGSVVELSDGSLGVVSAGNPDTPVKPMVIPVKDAEGAYLPKSMLNLASPDNTLSIVRSVPEATAGIDPAAVLDLPASPSTATQKY